MRGALEEIYICETYGGYLWVLALSMLLYREFINRNLINIKNSQCSLILL